MLTVPENLRIWFYRKPELLDELMREGHGFYEEVVSIWLKRQIDVGSVAGKREVDEVDALTFIGRMVQHILPKGFQRIRYYGLQSTCRANRIREELNELLNNIDDKIKDTYKDTYKVTGYRERIKKSFGKDPLICTRCGDEMEFRGIWHPRYGWIVDNWDSFFAGDIEVGDEKEQKSGSSVQQSESVLQLQMSFM